MKIEVGKKYRLKTEAEMIALNKNCVFIEKMKEQNLLGTMVTIKKSHGVQPTDIGPMEYFGIQEDKENAWIDEFCFVECQYERYQKLKKVYDV